MSKPIYLDNHASTPVDPRVLEQMLPFFSETYGNPSSTGNAHGRAARDAVERAREQVAHLIGASPAEIVFTSGATEASNLAIKGVVGARQRDKRHVITSRIEHKATLESVRSLEADGVEVSYLEPGRDGLIRPEQVAEALREETVLVTLMLANNEIGTLTAIDEVGRLTRPLGVALHCDAVQGVGRVAFDVQTAQVDLVSLSAHKVYGPKGVGALYIRGKPKLSLRRFLDGGGQERGIRPGTLNVPGIVGFGAAAELAKREGEDEEAARTRSLRERLQSRLEGALPRLHVHGSLDRRLPGNLSVAFECVEARRLLELVGDAVSLSAGSACTATATEPSHVLRGIGVSRDLTLSTIRFGIGRFNTEGEIDEAASHVIGAVQKLREESEVWQLSMDAAV